MEGVLAAFAQFDNDCRSDRTRAGMKAALELGRWTFLAPIGYLNAPSRDGKNLIPISDARRETADRSPTSSASPLSAHSRPSAFFVRLSSFAATGDSK